MDRYNTHRCQLPFSIYVRLKSGTQITWNCIMTLTLNWIVKHFRVQSSFMRFLFWRLVPNNHHDQKSFPANSTEALYSFGLGWNFRIAAHKPQRQSLLFTGIKNNYVHDSPLRLIFCYVSIEMCCVLTQEFSRTIGRCESNDFLLYGGHWQHPRLQHQIAEDALQMGFNAFIRCLFTSSPIHHEAQISHHMRAMRFTSIKTFVCSIICLQTKKSTNSICKVECDVI